MKIEYKVIVFSIICGIFSWIIDAGVDTLFFYEGPFLKQLISDASPHQIFMRSITGILFLIFGIIISKYIAKQRQTGEELKKYRDHLEDLIKERTNQLEKTNEHLQIEYKVIIFSIFCGIFSWIIDALVDSLFFYKGPFFKQLISDASPHQIFMRSITGILFLIFGIIISKYIAKQKQAEEELKKYRDHLEDLVQERTFQLETANEQLKKAEEKARSAYLELNQIFDAAINGMCLISKDFSILRVNKKFCTFFGITKDKAIGKKCSDIFMHPLCHTPNCPVSLILKKDREFYECDTEIQNKEGIKISCILTVTPFRELNGELIGIIESFIDITQRKQNEELLRESEEKYSTLVENAQDGVVIIQDGVYQFVNKPGAKLGGYEIEELIGLPFLNVIENEFKEAAIQRYNAHLEEKEVPFVFELKVVCKNGTIKEVEITSGLIQYNMKPAVMVIFRDMTEHKEFERELQKVQKLESLGVLVGGIAHDFNNLLTAIIGNLSLIELYAKSGENIFEVLDETKKASQQTRHLTQQLLTFSKGGEPIKEVASISELINETVCFALSGSKLRCECSFPDNLWPVEIDKGQINQMINNLVINADQAMPQGGLIQVCVENVIVRPEDGLPLKEGKYVKILIKDHGIGIPEAYLSKLFDPYFTTKQKGSGLGLSITYSIVQKHEGHITVESKIGSGTMFSIYLPALEKEVFTVQKIEEKIPVLGKGKILFMDDQKGIRNMIRKMLIHLGYEVDFAGDGAEAIEMYKMAKEEEQPFDVVILDLTVPGGMGGKETVKRLLEIDPKLKAIVSSGYSNDPVLSEYKNYGFKGVVAKPYEIQGLSETLFMVMTGKQKTHLKT